MSPFLNSMISSMLGVSPSTSFFILLIVSTLLLTNESKIVNLKPYI